MMHQVEKGGGVSGLRFVCQFCGEFIDDAGMGVLVWDWDGGEALPVHKRCNTAKGDPYTLSQEIDTGLMYLLWNTGLRDKEKFERAHANAEGLQRLYNGLEAETGARGGVGNVRPSE